MNNKIFIIITFLILPFFYVQAQNIEKSENCIGKYLFNNNISDQSPIKNDGIAHGGNFTFDRNGKANSAYHFNGNGDYIEIKNPVKNDFTVAFWLRTMQSGYNAEDGAFYGSTGMVDNECIGCGNDFGVDLLDDRVVFGIDEYHLPSTTYINSGQWAHVAAVRDSATAKMFLYINGKLDTTLNTDPDYYIEIGEQPDIYFGKLHAADEDEKPFFNGDLDDIYIFNRALSDKEIFKLAYGNISKAGLLTFKGSVVLADKPVVLRDIRFNAGKADIQVKGKLELDAVAAWLKKYPDIKIELSGHTSTDGDKAVNDKLSGSRADACKKYLIGKGIAENRIISKGHGSDFPVVANKTEEGRRANRRVELKIIKTN
ncbi:MAG: LamG-like jellyroll fold domain-containing protein [Bacteroidota bacterium]